MLKIDVLYQCGPLGKVTFIFHSFSSIFLVFFWWSRSQWLVSTQEISIYGWGSTFYFIAIGVSWIIGQYRSTFCFFLGSKGDLFLIQKSMILVLGWCVDLRRWKLGYKTQRWWHRTTGAVAEGCFHILQVASCCVDWYLHFVLVPPFLTIIGTAAVPYHHPAVGA